MHGWVKEEAHLPLDVISLMCALADTQTRVCQAAGKRAARSTGGEKRRLTAELRGEPAPSKRRRNRGRKAEEVEEEKDHLASGGGAGGGGGGRDGGAGGAGGEGGGGPRRPSYTIFPKREVVRYCLSLPHDAAHLKLVQAHFTDRGVSVGSGQLSRWRQQYVRHKWEYLPEESCRNHKEVPNWARRALGIGVCKGTNINRILPQELQQSFDNALCARIHGPDDHKLEEPLSNKDWIVSMKKCIQVNNKRAAMEIDKAKAINADVLNKYLAGEMSFDEASATKVQVPTIAMGKPTHQWARRCRAPQGWKRRALSPTGKFLAFNHPKMKLFRALFKLRMAEHRVHERLVLNFDQVYKERYRVKAKKIWKRKRDAGTSALEEQSNTKMRRVWDKEHRRHGVYAKAPKRKRPWVCAHDEPRNDQVVDERKRLR